MRDLLDRKLTTSPEAEAAYRSGLEALLRLQRGALAHFARALALDPTFALAHAALAVMGHELCAPVDVAARLGSARLHARRATPAERSHVEAVAGHVAGDRGALVRHLADHPDDALLLSVAVPTIAFAGVTRVAEHAWALVEAATPALGDHWFHQGLLAFVRQEQGRWTEAYDLAVRALDQEPGAGHAAHARAHVHYETGDHAAGLAWLDAWIGTDGADIEDRSHYCWHAALHELSRGDLAAVDRRFRSQLSPAHVQGCRSVVDTGSLLWRWRITPGASGVPGVAEGVAAPEETLLRPPTPFLGLHSAVTLCAADDARGLARLACWAGAHDDAVHRAVVAPLATALRFLVLGQPSACADELVRLLPHLPRVGGSDAQREVVEETLLTALLRAGRYDEARALVDRRLDRRRCRRDVLWQEACRDVS